MLVFVFRYLHICDTIADNIDAAKCVISVQVCDVLCYKLLLGDTLLPFPGTNENRSHTLTALKFPDDVFEMCYSFCIFLGTHGKR